MAGGLGGHRGVLIGDEVAQMAVLLLADGGLQAHRLLGHPHDLAHLIHGHIQRRADLVGGGLMAVLMQQLAGHLLHLIDGLHHVHRNADGAGLVRNGAGNGLANPPGGIGGEFEALGVIELIHRLDQAQVALLDQIQELHAAAHIPLGNRDHQTQVGLAQALLGALALGAALLNVLGQLDLLIAGQQGHPADFLQVDLHGVIDGHAVGRQAALELLHALLSEGKVLGVVLRLVHHFNAVAFQRLVQLVDLLHVKAALFDGVRDLLAVQFAGALAVLQQFPQHILLFCHMSFSSLFVRPRHRPAAFGAAFPVRCVSFLGQAVLPVLWFPAGAQPSGQLHRRRQPAGFSVFNVWFRGFRPAPPRPFCGEGSPDNRPAPAPTSSRLPGFGVGCAPSGPCTAPRPDR